MQNTHNTLKIIQITDLHLSNEPRCINAISEHKKRAWLLSTLKIKKSPYFKYKIFEQTSYQPTALSYIDEQIKEINPKHVFITGDIAVSSCQLSEAEKLFTSRITNNDTDPFLDLSPKATLLQFFDKSIFMPGNHDLLHLSKNTYLPTPNLFFDRVSFDRIFPVTQTGRLKHTTIGNIVFLFYDFSWSSCRYSKYKPKTALKKFKHYFGSGIVTEEDRDKLREFFTKNRSKKIIFISHYPIYKVKPEDKNLILQNRKSIQTLLENYDNIKLIMTGHTHEYCYKATKIPQIVCGTSMACNSDDEYCFIEYTVEQSEINIKTHIFSIRNREHTHKTYEETVSI